MSPHLISITFLFRNFLLTDYCITSHHLLLPCYLDTDALSAAVREAEESYIKSRPGSARRKDLSASSITDGESGEVVNR